MKLAYITTISPFDKYSWSGTNYYVRTALEAQGCDLQCIYGYRKITFRMIFRKMQALFTCKKYQAVRSYVAANGWADYISETMEDGLDAVFSLSTIPVSCLETDKPIFLYIDGCYEYMLEHGFNRLLNSIAVAHAIERLAFVRSARIFTSSEASSDAIGKYYGREILKKVEVVPFGANIDEFPSRKSVMDNICAKDMDVCRILFVGVDWGRKGADLVVDTVKLLHDKGFPVELHLVGLRNIQMLLPPYIINHGFINKMDGGGMDKLVSLYKDCHFLFVPSRGEAFGLVFCEASAYGLPSISHSVGGITTVVVDGENGKLFPLGTQPSDFAKYIECMFADKDAYKELSAKTYERYTNFLNWRIAGERLVRGMSASSI